MDEYRFFRADPAVYESVRLSLNAAWGLPAEGQETCIPIVSLVTKQDGRAYFAARLEWCNLDAVVASLPGLLASGAVEEIDEATYRASLPTDPPMPTAPAPSPTLSPTAAPSGGGTLAPGVAPPLGGAIRR